LSPLGKNFYLNITPNNLVRLYLRTDAVSDGSPTSVRIRELSAKDWETTVTEATVTNCVSGGISTDSTTLRTHNKNLVTNPMQKQSLSELVTSLRNCSSVRTPGANRVALSVVSIREDASVQSSVPHSSRGNLSERDSLHHVHTAPLKLHDKSKISHSDQRHTAQSTAPRHGLSLCETRCSETPGPTTGAKFRFKRTPNTPVLSQVQSSVDVQQTSPHLQSSAARNQPRSLMSASISHTASAVGQVANTAVDDMWDTGKQSITNAVYTTNIVC